MRYDMFPSAHTSKSDVIVSHDSKGDKHAEWHRVMPAYLNGLVASCSIKGPTARADGANIGDRNGMASVAGLLLYDISMLPSRCGTERCHDMLRIGTLCQSSQTSMPAE